MTSLRTIKTPDEGLKRLQEGNRRFVENALLHPNQSEKRRLALVENQNPYAVIVTCSDSRVAPEVIFDEGLGDFFVIRVGGNVIGPTELESVQFAVEYLQPVIIIVMGHESCRAIQAVLKGQTEDIPAIATLIEPSVEKAKSIKSTNLLKRITELNAKKMRTELLKSAVIDKKVKGKSIGLYAAYYSMQTGKVSFL